MYVVTLAFCKQPLWLSGGGVRKINKNIKDPRFAPQTGQLKKMCILLG
jgi:hypothetical protein